MKRQVIVSLSRLADLADDAGNRAAADEFDAIASCVSKDGKGKCLVSEKTSSRIVEAGFSEWLSEAVYGGPAGRVVYEIESQGLLNQLAAYANALISPKVREPGRRPISKKDFQEKAEPLYAKLKEFWQMAKKAAVKFPELPDLNAFLWQRGAAERISAREAKHFVDNLRAMVDRYVNQHVAQKIDNPRPQRAKPRFPVKWQLPKPPGADKATGVPTQAPQPKPRIDELKQQYQKDWQTPYFHGKQRLTEPVVDAIKQNWTFLPRELRNRAPALIDFIQSKANVRTALKVEDVYNARKRDVEVLFEDFFGQDLDKAQVFMAKVFADLEKVWNEEFQEVPEAATPAAVPTPGATPAVVSPPPPSPTAPAAPSPTPAPAAASAPVPAVAPEKPRQIGTLGGQEEPQVVHNPYEVKKPKGRFWRV